MSSKKDLSEYGLGHEHGFEEGFKEGIKFLGEKYGPLFAEVMYMIYKKENRMDEE